MDDDIEDLDENGNFHLRFVLGPWSPEQQALADSFHTVKGIKPISSSFFQATSPSMDYVDNATNIINNLLNERRNELKDGDYEIVFVWDIGEITTVTSRQFMHSAVFHRDINAHSLVGISNRILDSLKFSCVYDKKNVVNIEDVDEAELEELREHVPMYEALEKFYNEITDGMRDDGPIINYELIERCELTGRILELYSGAVQMQRLFHQRWKTARKCLEMINKKSDKSNRKYENIVLCGDGIGDGAAQLLIAGCSKHIPFQNIYCYVKESISMTFGRIQKRFGDKCVLVYITSEPDALPINEKLQIPIWEIKANDSIEHLSNALQNVLFR